MTGGAFLIVRLSLKQGKAMSPIDLSGGYSSISSSSPEGGAPSFISCASAACIASAAAVLNFITVNVNLRYALLRGKGTLIALKHNYILFYYF